MKRLTIVRHAHAEPERPGLKDFDRPLSTRGIEEARVAARQSADNLPSADLIVSSPAARALATAQIFADALAYPHRKIATDNRLYLASPDDLCATIQNTADTVGHLVVFGHNPGLSDFTRLLGPNRNCGDLPTAGSHSLEVPIEMWSDFEVG